MIVTFFLKLGTFFINYFGKLDTLINTLEYVVHLDILCNVRSIKKKIELLGLCNSDALIGSNHHFHLF
jgi:hypothetical protein